MSESVREDVAGLCQPAVTVRPDVSLQEVARRLWVADVGAAVVVNGGPPQGMISERDVVTQLAQGVHPGLATAAQAMTRPAVCARVDDRLLDVAFQMIDHRIRHVPVMDKAGEVVGVVSVRDVIRPLLRDVLEG